MQYKSLIFSLLVSGLLKIAIFRWFEEYEKTISDDSCRKMLQIRFGL